MTNSPATPLQFNQQGAPGSAPEPGQASAQPAAPQAPAEQPAAEPPAQQPATQEPGQGAARQPEFITKAEALQMVQDALHKSQSHTDKTAARITKELTRLQQAGIQATPEQVQALIDQEAGSAQPSQPAPAAPVSPPAAAPAQAQTQAQPAPGSEQDPVTAAAVAIMQEAGIQVEEADPEFAMVDTKTDNAGKFLASVNKAVQAKRERIQRDPAARIPSLGGGSGAGSSGVSSMSGVDTLESYFTSH